MNNNNYNVIRAQFEGNGSGNRPTHIYAEVSNGVESVVACRRHREGWDGVQYCEIRGISYFLFEDRYFNLTAVDDEMKYLWETKRINLAQYNEFYLYMDMLMLGYYFNPDFTAHLIYSAHPEPRLLEGTVTDMWMQFIDWDESIDKTLMDPDDGDDVELGDASIGTFLDPPPISAEADGALEDMNDILAVWTVPSIRNDLDFINLTLDIGDGELIDLTDDTLDME